MTLTGRRPWLRRHPDRLDCYHESANTILAVSIIGAILASLSGRIPGWAGFVAAFAPAFVATALIHARRNV